jgi:pimeloyl-ACP methyl ester carboxylesterase
MGLLRTAYAIGHRWLLVRGVESRTVEGAGGPLHFYDAPGTGRHGTLVLQHGIGAESLHFFPILAALRRHFGRVILPDLAGHGRSAPAPEMSPEALFTGFAAVLDHAVPEPAVVFGNSLGGAMAVQWAIERPERTRALILASPAGAILEEAALTSFLSRFTFPDRPAVLAFFAQLNPRVPWGSSLVADDVRASFLRPHIRALLASVRPDHGFAPAQLAAIRSPTLLVWGRSDRLMPREMLAWYRAHLPAGATIEEPEGIGHCPQTDSPSWTVRRIRVFTETLTKR